eukprot:231916_1
MNEHNKSVSLIVSVMKKCMQHKRFHDVLFLYDDYNTDKNIEMHSLALEACIRLKHLSKGKEIENSINKNKLFRNSILIKNNLIELYGKCSLISNAMNIFDKIPNKYRDMNTYMNMLNVLIYEKHYNDALKFYNDNMSQLDHTTNKYVNYSLIELYSKCDQLHNAEKIFNDYTEKDIDQINTLMTAYFEKGKYNKLMLLYNEYITSEIFKGTEFTYQTIMNTYIKLSDTKNANYIYNKFLSKTRMKDIQESNKKNTVLHGRRATETDLLIMDCFNNGKYRKALDIYRNESDVNKSYITHTLAIKSCTALNDLQTGKEIHSNIKCVEENLYENNIEIKISFIDFYGKCSPNINNALNIFNSINDKDIVCIGSMMNVYIKHKKDKEAIRLYDEYIGKCKSKNIRKEIITHKIAIKACTHLKYSFKGKEIHSKLIINFT